MLMPNDISSHVQQAKCKNIICLPVFHPFLWLRVPFLVRKPDFGCSGTHEGPRNFLGPIFMGTIIDLWD